MTPVPPLSYHPRMRAGFAKQDITPDPGCMLNGFIARSGPSRGVDTPLYARALFLEQGRRKALVIGLDLLAVSTATADGLTAGISSETGIPEANVVITCTHTHAGPMTARLRGLGKADEAFLKNLEARVLAAARQAVGAAASADAAWGTARVAVGVNRRQPVGDGSVMLGVNPGGPHDRQVRVLRLKGSGRPILVFEHASHPYCLGPDDLLISADFWGHAAAALDEAGYDSVYFNGCAGNISPRRGFGGPAAARREGRRLARAVLRAAVSARPEVAPRLAAGSRRVELAYDSLPPLAEIRAQLRQPDRTVRKEDRSRSRVRARVRRAWKEWLAELTETLARGPLPPAAARVSLLRVGRGAIVFFPGEVFFETGERAAAALAADPAAVAAYGHGYIGYVPSAEAYAEGGYEVNESHRYVGLWRWHPETSDRFVQTAQELWDELKRRPAGR